MDHLVDIEDKLSFCSRRVAAYEWQFNFNDFLLIIATLGIRINIISLQEAMIVGECDMILAVTRP